MNSQSSFVMIMYLITDTYLPEDNLRVMHDDGERAKMIGLQVTTLNIRNVRQNLLEWVRQLEVMMELLNMDTR